MNTTYGLSVAACFVIVQVACTKHALYPPKINDKLRLVRSVELPTRGSPNSQTSSREYTYNEEGLLTSRRLSYTAYNGFNLLDASPGQLSQSSVTRYQYSGNQLEAAVTTEWRNVLTTADPFCPVDNINCYVPTDSIVYLDYEPAGPTRVVEYRYRSSEWFEIGTSYITYDELGRIETTCGTFPGGEPEDCSATSSYTYAEESRNLTTSTVTGANGATLSSRAYEPLEIRNPTSFLGPISSVTPRTPNLRRDLSRSVSIDTYITEGELLLGISDDRGDIQSYYTYENY